MKQTRIVRIYEIHIKSVEHIWYIFIGFFFHLASFARCFKMRLFTFRSSPLALRENNGLLKLKTRLTQSPTRLHW